MELQTRVKIPSQTKFFLPILAPFFSFGNNTLHARRAFLVHYLISCLTCSRTHLATYFCSLHSSCTIIRLAYPLCSSSVQSIHKPRLGSSLLSRRTQERSRYLKEKRDKKRSTKSNVKPQPLDDKVFAQPMRCASSWDFVGTNGSDCLSESSPTISLASPFQQHLADRARVVVVAA